MISATTSNFRSSAQGMRISGGIENLRQPIDASGQTFRIARDQTEEANGCIQSVVVTVVAIGKEDMPAHLAGQGRAGFPPSVS